jgi:two-component system, OmpR family, response regulator
MCQLLPLLTVRTLCSIAPLAALAPRGSRRGAAYFVVARRRKACRLAAPQHGGARSGVRLLRSLRSLRADRAGEPPTLSLLADERHVGSLLRSTAARDPVFDCSARCARSALLADAAALRADTWRVRVLLVDDEERMVAALRRGLAAEGFVVESASDGRSGLHLAQHGDFDAVVLDVMLPGLSGYEVVRRLRARGNWVPVLMLSAKDGEYDQADALDDGADDYLTKPFSFVVLLARIRALLRRGARARPVVLSAGDVKLDPASHQVWVGGASADLTPREFVLLEYLMRNAGRVIGKAELLDHVWDSAADVAPNAVEVYVGYLRRKIGNDRLITVRGVGYRIAS